MKRNTAIQLLRLLTEKEVRKLGKFLRSPYFNYSQPVIVLFECLRKWHPEYEGQRIRPLMFWKKVYPGKAFSEQKYWTLNFHLRCLIERFMAVEELEGNETEFKKQLIKSHGRRNAHALFEKETKVLVEKLNAQAWQDIYSYSESLWLKHDYFFNSLTDKYGGAIYSVEDAMTDLDRFYLLAKLRFASEIKNRERIFSKKVPVQLLDESLSASEIYEEENPAFLMYKNVLDLYDPEKAENAFKNGKELLGDKFSKLSKHDQNEVMLNLRNYAIRQLNRGRTGYWKELLGLYKLGLKLNLILDNDKISEVSFLNIVHAGCIGREFDWVESFIKQYNNCLDKNIQQDIEVFSLSILLFNKKKYDEALTLADGYNFKNILHKINHKILELKIWFEKFLFDNDLYVLMVSKLEADEKFIRRNKAVAEQKRIANLNFLIALKKLVEFKYRNKKNKEIRIKMINTIKDIKIINSRSWLLEKMEYESEATQ